MEAVVESYRKSGAEEALDDFSATKARRAELCRELGLEAQVEAQALAEEAGIFYKEITGYDLVMWRGFLQTAYPDWSEYSYDVIPEEALEDIRTAKSLGVFNALEIWTPEVPEMDVQREDPMVVGITGVGRDRRFFPVVRWGTEKILTFEEIERIVARQLQRERASEVKNPPESIFDYIIETFREVEGLSRYYVDRVDKGFRGRFKHCGERMYKVVWSDFTPKRFRVCAQCGHTQQVSY